MKTVGLKDPKDDLIYNHLKFYEDLQLFHFQDIQLYHKYLCNADKKYRDLNHINQ